MRFIIIVLIIIVWSVLSNLAKSEETTKQFILSETIIKQIDVLVKIKIDNINSIDYTIIDE